MFTPTQSESTIPIRWAGHPSFALVDLTVGEGPMSFIGKWGKESVFRSEPCSRQIGTQRDVGGRSAAKEIACPDKVRANRRVPNFLWIMSLIRSALGRVRYCLLVEVPPRPDMLLRTSTPARRGRHVRFPIPFRCSDVFVVQACSLDFAYAFS